MAYLYRHIRIDKNEPFYIGIGCSKYYIRATTKNFRNRIWHSIINKTDYIVEIMLDDLSWEEVREKEIEFIKLYGRIDNKTGILSNMTDGGQGNYGYIPSKECLEKISTSSKGRIGYWKGKKLTVEARKRISESKIGKTHKGKPASEKVKEAVRKHSIGNKYSLGRICTNESKRKISEANTGRVAYNKGKSGLSGSLNGMFGKTHTIEARKNISDKLKKCPIIQFDLNNNIIKKFRSIREAASFYGIFDTGISACCRNKPTFKTYKGSIWKYDN